jgi:uncharacterized membrane protein
MKWSQKIKNCNFDILLNLALAALLLFFVFIIPPFQKPDEPYHYYKTLAYVSGNFSKDSSSELNSTFARLPELALTRIGFTNNEAYDFSQVKANLLNKSEESTTFSTTIAWWQIAYLPNVMGMLVGKFLFANSIFVALCAFFTGRLFMALCYFVTVIFLKKYVPKSFKPLFYAFVFLPMIVNQVTSFSYDGLLIILSLISFISLLQVLTKSPNRKWFFILTLSLALQQWVKPGYYLLPLMIFFLPIKGLFGSKKGFFIFLCFFLFFSYLPSIINLGTVGSNFTQDRTIFIDGRRINAGEQLEIILSNPFVFIKALIITSFYTFGNYLIQFIGILGWLTYEFPSWFYYVYVSVLLFSSYWAVKNEKNYFLTFFQWLLLLCLLFGSYVLIHLAMYLSWSEVASLVITGVQGRYFVPLLPLLFLVFHDFYLFAKQNKSLQVFLVISLFAVMSFTVFYTAKNRYYNFRTQWQNTDLVLADLEQKSQSDQSKSFSLPVSLEATASRQTTGFAIAIDHYEATQAANLLYQIRDADCQKVLLQAFVSPEDRYENAILLVKHQLLGAGEYCYQIQDVSNSPSPFQLRGEDSAFIDVLLLP